MQCTELVGQQQKSFNFFIGLRELLEVSAPRWPCQNEVVLEEIGVADPEAETLCRRLLARESLSRDLSGQKQDVRPMRVADREADSRRRVLGRESLFRDLSGQNRDQQA